MAARIWGRSSVGRAPALQAGGQEFESLRLHCGERSRNLHLENRILKRSRKKKPAKGRKSSGEEAGLPKDRDIREKKKDPGESQGKRTEKAERYPPKGLSKKEHGEDAWALRAEERRDKLRKAAGRSKYPLIRGCLNGETRLNDLQAPVGK